MKWNNMMKNSQRILSLLVILIIFSFVNPKLALAAKNLRIISYNYSTHFRPGETVSFTVTVQNNETINDEWGEVDIALTNQITGITVSPYTIDETTLPHIPKNGGTYTLTNFQQRTPLPWHNWSATEGRFTVKFILYDGDGNAAHTVYGSEPIHVGRAVDSVSAFPNIIDLGVIPYGRYMYPNPIKIHWDFYLKNQLRKDQPWYMRIYTDNSSRYKGIDGTIYKSRRKYTTSKIWVRTSGEGSPSGLVSSDGKYNLPIKVWCLNYGPDWDETGWNTNLLGPPPVNDDYVWIGPQLDDGKRDTDRGVWLWIPDYMDMSGDKRTWRRLIGQDPYDRELVSDNNPTGDATLDSPFDIYLATEGSPTSVIGKYTGKIIIEIYTP